MRLLNLVALAASAVWTAPAISAPIWPLPVAMHYAEPTLPPAPSVPEANGLPFYVTPSVGASEDSLYDPISLLGEYRARPLLRFVDTRSYAFTPQAHFMMISTEGNGGEGHAIVILFYLDENGFHIDGAFGLYSNNSARNWSSSFLMTRPHETYDSETTSCRNPDCSVDFVPASSELAAYRSGWQGFFGPVAHQVAQRLLIAPGTAAVLRLDAVMYYVRLHAMRERFASPMAVTPDYVSGEFVADWTALLDLACFNLSRAVCNSSGRNDVRWPQARLAIPVHDYWGAVAFHGMAAVTGWRAVDGVHSIEMGEEDLVDGAERPGFTGSGFVCFGDEPTARWGARGGRRIRAYQGAMRDGRPHGEGTLFFGSCEDAQSDPENQPRLKSTFVDGVPQGNSEAYDASGDLRMAGGLRNGLLHGQARFFGEGGTEMADAAYEMGEPTDDSLYLAELDYYFVGTGPPLIRRAFTGSIGSGALRGEWTDLLLTADRPDGTHFALLGDRLYIEEPNGHWAIGVARKRGTGRRYFLSGEGENHFSNGDITIGTWRADGLVMTGPARYWRNSHEKWYPVVLDQEGRGQITITRRTGSWIENIGAEVTRWANDTVGVVSSTGAGFERFMCRLTGTKEGENCGVAGGVSYGPGGPVLTDGSGTPSEVPTGGTNEIDWEVALNWQRTAEMSDFERAAPDHFPWMDSIALSRAPASAGLSHFQIEMGTPTAAGAERGCDGGGCGHFGARRSFQETRPDGTTVTRYRMHNGTDYLVAPGDMVLSPASGVVTEARDGFIQIRTPQGNRVEISYVLPMKGTLPITRGREVTRGSIIGHAENISARYRGTPNHVHVQYWTPAARANRGFWVSPDGRTRAAGRGDTQ